MDLAFNLLLTILVELPIIAFFFRKRKRKFALTVGLFVNVITWPIINIIRLNTDWDLNWVQVGVVILEGFAYWFFLGKHPKKAVLITILANSASYLATKFIHLPADLFQKSPTLIK